MIKVKSLGIWLAALAVCGCGSGNPDTAKVTGTVTHNGSPVEGASVAFVPSSEGGKTATAITDAAGKFSLTSFEKDDGAIPGSYKVAITKSEVIGGMSAEEEHAAAEAGKPVSEAQTTQVLPPKYGDSATSGLTADVVAGEPNEFTFELTDE